MEHKNDNVSTPTAEISNTEIEHLPSYAPSGAFTPLNTGQDDKKETNDEPPQIMQQPMVNPYFLQERLEQEPTGDSHVIMMPSEPINKENESNTLKEKRRFCAWFCEPALDPAAWSSLFYFTIVSWPIGILGASFIFASLFIAFASMFFPPLGIFVCIGTGWVWRAIARLELYTIQMCTHPRAFFNCTLRENSTSQYPPIKRINNDQAEKKGLIRYAISICFDKFTWMAFVYFVQIAYAALLT
ncbi:hypothetical protein G9A89_002661 [Geosiphon pyriformis]|nr:hypothetical protein G9A89_002661 [Geosiphon pyriformis]